MRYATILAAIIAFISSEAFAEAQSSKYKLPDNYIKIPENDIQNKFQIQISRSVDFNSLYLGMTKENLIDKFKNCVNPNTGVFVKYYSSNIGFYVSESNKILDGFQFRLDGIVLYRPGDNTIYKEFSGSIHAACKGGPEENLSMVFTPPWPKSRLASLQRKMKFLPETAPTLEMLSTQIKTKYGTPSVEISNTDTHVISFYWKDAKLVPPSLTPPMECETKRIVSNDDFFAATRQSLDQECDQLIIFEIKEEKSGGRVESMNTTAIDYQIIEKITSQRENIKYSAQWMFDGALRDIQSRQQPTLPKL
ncbi:MAG TPA: hypothetical protein PLK13_05315 [Xanthobacteraceae bacterium]|jgi:hypothetical protein|nr:hypothetical protein [Xanthobacteraceae bacterium]HQS47411.1 hypothetical protein [Xanthobacteraceae bacterium]